MKLVVKALAALAVLVVIGVGALVAHRAWRQHELAREQRITSVNGIDDGRFLRVNGMDEWVTLRGENRDNPVVLFLHGGPSEANSPFVGFFRPFEKDYVFVQWDQPGAGKTFIRAGARRPKLTLEGIADDGVAVAERLQAMFHGRRIILVGQDWGGLVGLEMIRKRPDLFEAFFGTGQIVSWLGEQTPQYEGTLRRAAAAQDQKTLDGLAKVGAPPYRSLVAYRRFGDYFEPYKSRQDQAAVGRLRAALYFSPQLSWPQMFGWGKALRSGEDELTPTLMDIDLRKADSRFQVPVFFIQGADDSITPTSMIAAWLPGVQAPAKHLDVVPGAGHMVMWEKPQAFLALMSQDLKLASTTAR
jgi:pimeloyl-ACP methyl ester carboxylesterase